MGERGSGTFLLGLLRDWGLALGFAVLAWGLYMRLFGPGAPTRGAAPDFALPDVTTGAPIALSALGDGPIVLNFWFTSCGPCRAEIPELARFHAENPTVPMLGVSVDSMSTGRLAETSRRLGVTWTVVHDLKSRVSADYGISLFPTTVVVRGGKIEDVHLGVIDAAGLRALVAP